MSDFWKDQLTRHGVNIEEEEEKEAAAKMTDCRTSGSSENVVHVMST